MGPPGTIMVKSHPHGPTLFCRPIALLLLLQKHLSLSLSHSLSLSTLIQKVAPPSTTTTTMEPSVDDLADDIDKLSFTSSTTTNTTTTTTTAVDSTSSVSSTPYTNSSSSSSSSSTTKHHHYHSPTCRDPCWRAIQQTRLDNRTLTLSDLRFVQRLGSGDIGSVYLVELKGSNGCLFAAKVMDKKELVTRNKESRARIEREILETLDHPFLPTLYATLDCPRWSCLLTEFCPGGDLHLLRQRQPDKRFNEAAVQ